jgi:hypothetical protein
MLSPDNLSVLKRRFEGDCAVNPSERVNDKIIRSIDFKRRKNALPVKVTHNAVIYAKVDSRAFVLEQCEMIIPLEND